MRAGQPKRLVFIRIPDYYPFAEKARHPQDVYPPFAVGYMATLAKHAGFAVTVLDGDGEPMTLPEMLRRASGAADAYFIEVVTPVADLALRLAEALKKETQAPIVVFGQHASALPASMLEPESPIDFALLDEAEDTFLALLARLPEASEDKAAAFAGFKGVAYRDGSGALRVQPKGGFIEDLDALPFIDLALLPYWGYRKLSFPVPSFRRAQWGFMLTSRGCPYHCIFCSPTSRQTIGKGFHAMSAERIAAEMRFQATQFGVNAVSFEDDIFSLDQTRVRELAELLASRGNKVPWIVQTRHDCLSPDLVRTMRRAGCMGISVGIESGSNRILEVIRKDTSKEAIRETVRAVHETGMNLRLLFMIGNPTETREEIEETIAFARELTAVTMQVSFCTPYPGTTIFDPERPGAMNFSGYSDYNNLQSNLSAVSDEELVRLHRRFYRAFYLSPKYLWLYARRRLPYLPFNAGHEWFLVKKTLAYLFSGKVVNA